MWQQILPGLRLKLFLTVVLGVVYPLVMTGVAQALFPDQANGSLITSNGTVIGSELIGQPFSKPEYFHPRPSSAGSGYDATSSGGSNLGPTSAKLVHGTTKMDDKKNEVIDFDGINLRIVHYSLENGLPYQSSAPMEQFKTSTGDLDDVKLIKAFNDGTAPLTFRPQAPIPADAVTASASGLDPHISPDSARAQAGRIAKARGVSIDRVNQLIAQVEEAPALGLLGEPRVNVLRLNLALDNSFKRASVAEGRQ